MQLPVALTLAFLACHALSLALDLGALIAVSLAVYGDPCAGWPAAGQEPCRVTSLDLYGYQRTFCPLQGAVAYRSDGRFYFLGAVNEPCLFPIWAVSLAGFAHLGVLIYGVWSRAPLGDDEAAPSWTAAAVLAGLGCLAAELAPCINTQAAFNAMCWQLDKPMCAAAAGTSSDAEAGDCNPTGRPLPRCADYGGGSFVGRWRAGLALMYTGSACSLAQLALSVALLAHWRLTSGRQLREQRLELKMKKLQQLHHLPSKQQQLQVHQVQQDEWTGGQVGSGVFGRGHEAKSHDYDQNDYDQTDYDRHDQGDGAASPYAVSDVYGLPEEMMEQPIAMTAASNPAFEQEPQQLHQPEPHQQGSLEQRKLGRKKSAAAMGRYSTSQI